MSIDTRIEQLKSTITPLIEQATDRIGQVRESAELSTLAWLGLQRIPSLAARTSPVVGSFGAGFALGAAAGLLFAPMKGSELRSRIRKSVVEALQDTPVVGPKISEFIDERFGDGELGDKTYDELYTMAQEAGIRGRSGMDKSELIEALGSPEKSGKDTDASTETAGTNGSAVHQ